MLLILGSHISDKLQKLKTKIVPMNECLLAHKKSLAPVNRKKNICAGGDAGIYIYVSILIKIRIKYEFIEKLFTLQND